MSINSKTIEEAIARGVRRYFDGCRGRIPGFVDAHLRGRQALSTNRAALGLDILRAPVNLFWAPFYACICILKWLVRQSTGAGQFYRLLEKIPAGFTTNVQRRITNLVLTELVKPEQLRLAIDASLSELYQQEQLSKQASPQEQIITAALDDVLEQYSVTRTASADITNSLSCTIFGAFAFHKFTPGGIGIALVFAALWAKAQAVDNFLLGSSLGSWYYTLFPPEPSAGVMALMIGLVLAGLSVLAALSGAITDPVQTALGLHRYRLKKLIDTLEKDVLDKTQGSFRPKDQFVARIIDTVDAVKSSIH